MKEHAMQLSRRSKWLTTGAVALGAAVGAAGIAGAATSTSTSSSNSSTSSSASAPAARPDPATISHGPGETLLTGTTADKVKAAALAAVPGATVIRVETDSAGSPYEAHMKKTDGTYVTVKVDSSFKVTETDDGFGAGPPGGQTP
jgi:hypothetical protein